MFSIIWGLFRSGRALGVTWSQPPVPGFASRESEGQCGKAEQVAWLLEVEMKLDVRSPEVGAGFIRGQNWNLAEHMEV